ERRPPSIHTQRFVSRSQDSGIDTVSFNSHPTSNARNESDNPNSQIRRQCRHQKAERHRSHFRRHFGREESPRERWRLVPQDLWPMWSARSAIAKIGGQSMAMPRKFRPSSALSRRPSRVGGSGICEETAAALSEPAPFRATGWKTVWLDHFSFNA